MIPSELFLLHIDSVEFEEGVDRGKWGIADLPRFPDSPFAFFWIKSSTGRFYFRFDLNDYNNSAPAGCLWDIEKNAQLLSAQFPKGSEIVTSVFKQPGNLYAPCDRNNGHPEWKDHPDYGKWVWVSNADSIVKYLRFLYNVLSSTR